MKKNPPIAFTPEMDARLIELYPNTPNAEITRLTGWTTHQLKYNCKRLGLKKSKACKAWMANATLWTPERNKFLKENFFKMTNKQLADALGLRLTVVRNQTRALGLKRYQFDNWTAEETKFLIDNYQTMGDVEIMEHLMKQRPERVPLKRKCIKKKRTYLNLNRTPEQIALIVSRHLAPGGRSHTIYQNSGAISLNDKAVATYLSTGAGHKVNKTLKQELLQHPDLLDLKRQQLLLNRKIKEVRNVKN